VDTGVRYELWSSHSVSNHLSVDLASSISRENQIRDTKVTVCMQPKNNLFNGLAGLQ
jgi:hypothetical protein